MVMTMATTKIWAIKDSLSRVVSYAKNPEKTIFSDFPCRFTIEVLQRRKK